MIEDVGRVVKVAGDKALVTVERTSACPACGLQHVEGLMPGGKPVFEVLNMAGANIGDRVKVRVESGSYMKLSALFYGVLILLLITGAILGAYLAGKLNRSSDAMSAFVGILAVVFYYKKWGRKEYRPVIVEVIRENAAP